LKRRAIVYIDGFNLYYGALKGTPNRWLDLGAFCQRMVPKDDVVEIKYFTALVVPRPGKPHTAQRQQVYLRALGTIPHLTVHLGHFITTQSSRPLVNPPKRGSPFRTVWKTEEKGSDVNLASHLLIDCFRARYDVAIVVSNDSDLKEPVSYVRNDHKVPVGILNPHKNRSWALSPPHLPSGSFYKPIRQGAVAASQFPETLTDATGAFQRPKAWAPKPPKAPKPPNPSSRRRKRPSGAQRRRSRKR
jgi:uncharacterized LabA/DUF88 family protein